MVERLDSSIETIIWDLDGTLLNSFGVFQESLADALPAYGRELPSVEEMAKNFHGPLRESIDMSLGGNVPTAELDAILADFLTVQNTHYEVIDHHIYPDALDLAERASVKGLKQIIVTNREHEGRLNGSPRYIVEHSKLHGIIDTVICGDDGVHRKPKPAVIDALLQAGTIVPERTAVIGDQHVDAIFAYNLNARTGILVLRNEYHRPALDPAWPIVVVESLQTIQV